MYRSKTTKYWKGSTSNWTKAKPWPSLAPMVTARARYSPRSWEIPITMWRKDPLLWMGKTSWRWALTNVRKPAFFLPSNTPAKFPGWTALIFWRPLWMLAVKSRCRFLNTIPNCRRLIRKRVLPLKWAIATWTKGSAVAKRSETKSSKWNCLIRNLLC